MDHEAHLSCIMERRSIRKYTQEIIPEADIEKLVKAAMYAPSAVNKQPWHFIVISDREIFDRIMEVHPYASFLSGASHAILVCGDTELQHDDGYYVADCAAATENLLLAAHAMGIGSCWIGVYPREKREQAFCRLFSLPEHVRPFALISLGYPAETKPLPGRFKEERIHRNTWQG